MKSSPDEIFEIKKFYLIAFIFAIKGRERTSSKSAISTEYCELQNYNCKILLGLDLYPKLFIELYEIISLNFIHF